MSDSAGLQPDLCFGGCGREPVWLVVYRDPNETDYSVIGPAEQLLCEECLGQQLVTEGATGCNITVQPFVGCRHKWELKSEHWLEDSTHTTETICWKCGTRRLRAESKRPDITFGLRS